MDRPINWISPSEVEIEIKNMIFEYHTIHTAEKIVSEKHIL